MNNKLYKRSYFGDVILETLLNENIPIPNVDESGYKYENAFPGALGANTTSSNVSPVSPVASEEQSAAGTPSTNESGWSFKLPDWLDWDAFVEKAGKPIETLKKVVSLDQNATTGEYISIASLSAAGLLGAWYLWKKWKQNKDITEQDKQVADEIDSQITEASSTVNESKLWMSKKDYTSLNESFFLK